MTVLVNSSALRIEGAGASPLPPGNGGGRGPRNPGKRVKIASCGLQFYPPVQIAVCSKIKKRNFWSTCLFCIKKIELQYKGVGDGLFKTHGDFY